MREEKDIISLIVLFLQESKELFFSCTPQITII